MNFQIKQISSCPFCGSSNLKQGAFGFICNNCGLDSVVFAAHDEKEDVKTWEFRPFTEIEKEMYDALYDAMETLRSAGYGYTEECLSEADKILALLKKLDYE